MKLNISRTKGFILIIPLFLLIIILIALSGMFKEKLDVLDSFKYSDIIQLNSNFDNNEALLQELRDKDLITTTSSITIENIDDLNELDKNHSYFLRNDRISYSELPTINSPLNYSMVDTPIALIYLLRNDNIMNVAEVQKIYEMTDCDNEELKKCIEKYIEANKNKEENEHLGKYDILNQATLDYANSFIEELLNNTDDYKIYLGSEVYDILKGNSIDIDESIKREDFIDLILSDESGYTELKGIKINPECKTLYQAVQFLNELHFVQITQDRIPNTFHKDCNKYATLLFNYAMSKYPEIQEYSERKQKIKRGEIVDLPEFEKLNLSTEPLKNYISQPYETKFADYEIMPDSVRYIRDPKTNKILVAKDDIDPDINLDELQYRYVKEETSEDYFIDLSDIYNLKNEIIYFNEDINKLVKQNKLVYDSVSSDKYKEYLKSIEGIPLPVVLINMEVGRATPKSGDIDYPTYMKDVLEHSYTKGYDDLLYAVQDYTRYTQYPDLYKEENAGEKVVFNYNYYLLEGLLNQQSYNFLSTDIKDFLSTKDISNEIVENNEENLKKFVDDLKKNKYDELKIPKGYELVYKTTRFVNENSKNGNYPENIYPNIIKGQYSGLSMTVFFHKCYESKEFYDLWYGKKQ